uniref:FAT domain-containing protein n=1 Tax=Heterorhabditis bacteriophora TaxID=37862 RepID=A0A1I7WNC5_HETBA
MNEYVYVTSKTSRNILRIYFGHSFSSISLKSIAHFRSLVLTNQEMHPLRVKFSSLCRKQGKLSMCRGVLRELLDLDANAPLHTVLALCKQLWMDDLRGAAVSTLEALVRHLDRLPSNSHTPEAARLCAKVCKKKPFKIICLFCI